MKEGKNFLLGLLSLISLKLASAYGASFYSFNFRDLIFSVRDYLPFAVIFLGIFYASHLIFKKLIPRTGWAISLIFSILLTYGLSKLVVDFNQIFYKIGFSEDFLFHIAPWIVLALFALALWKWGFCKMLIMAGIILVILGIFGIAEQGFLSILIGTILVLIGLAIRRKKSYLEMNLSDREKYKKDRRFNREAELERWNNAGRRIGRGLAATKYYGSKPFTWGAKGIRNYNEKKAMERIAQAGRRAQERKTMERIAQAGRRAQEKSIARKERRLTRKREKQRERDRKSGLRRISQEKKLLERQLNDSNLSNHSKRVLERRRIDLDKRAKVLKKYGRNNFLF